MDAGVRGTRLANAPAISSTVSLPALESDGTASTGSAPSWVGCPQFGQVIRLPAASSGNSRCVPQTSQEDLANKGPLMPASVNQSPLDKASRHGTGWTFERGSPKLGRTMKVTYYLEVISSWCYWAEPAWAELKQRYAGRVDFGWKLALMDASGLPVSCNQCEWFYRRSGTITRSPFMLNSGWFEPGQKEYLAPNLVAEAA